MDEVLDFFVDVGNYVLELLYPGTVSGWHEQVSLASLASTISGLGDIGKVNDDNTGRRHGLRRLLLCLAFLRPSDWLNRGLSMRTRETVGRRELGHPMLVTVGLPEKMVEEEEGAAALVSECGIYLWSAVKV